MVTFPFHAVLKLDLCYFALAVAGLLSQPIPTAPKASKPFSHNRSHQRLIADPLNIWRDGYGLEHAHSAVHISSPDGWLAEGLSKTGECGKLNNRALKFKYSTDKTDFRKLELFQTTGDCLTVIANPFSIQVNFVRSLNELIVPFTAFQKANLSLGHSILLRGPLTLHEIELIDAAAAYGLGIPTAEIMQLVPNDHHVTVGLAFPNFKEPCNEPDLCNVSALNDSMVLEKSDVFEEYLAGPDKCVDLTNSFIRITYSASNSGQRKVSLEHKVFICENPLTNTVDSQIMFMQGTNLHVNIPHFAFQGSNPVLGHYIYINGPLTIHRVEVIRELERTVPFPIISHDYIRKSLVSIIDDRCECKYSPGRRASNPSTPYCALCSVNLKDATDVCTELIQLDERNAGGSVGGFVITYTTSVSARRSVKLAQSRKMKYRAGGSNSKSSGSFSTDIEIPIMLFAGRIRRAIFFTDKLNLKLIGRGYRNVLRISIRGPLIIHQLQYGTSHIAVLKQIKPIPSESLVGIPRIIKVFDNRHPSHNNPMTVVAQSNDQPPAMLIADPVNDSFHVAFSRSKNDNRNAFRFIYSLPEKGARNIIFGSEVDQRSADIVFSHGVYKEVIVPFAVFGVPISYVWHNGVATTAVVVSGPTTLHRIELVTTQQAAIPLRTNGRKYIRIGRNDLYNDARASVLSFNTSECNMNLDVMFNDEFGIDEGGLLKEFFSLVSREISRPSRGLFTTSPDANYAFEIDPKSNAKEGYLNDYRFVGRIIGLAISNRQILDIDFAPPIYKMILGKSMSLLDLRSIDPSVYWNLVRIRDMDVSDMGLYMPPNTICHGISSSNHHGPNEPTVTNANKELFIRHYWQQRVFKTVEAQANEMRLGVLDIVPNHWLQSMKVPILMQTISGTTSINISDWKEHTEYDGYIKNNETVTFFWECVSEWTNKQRGALLYFVTGSPRLPITGFKGLLFPFKIKNVDIQESKFPVAHTCVNTIDLPPYTSLEILKGRLEYAIDEGCGFGIS